MPTPAEQLTITSSKKEKQEAISACIKMMMDEHPEWEQKQAVAACYEMARRAMGHGAHKAQ